MQQSLQIFDSANRIVSGIALNMISNLFFLLVASACFCTGCLGMNDSNGTVILQERIEHLINYTAYKALEHLNLKKIGNNVANIAYKKYKDKLGKLIITFKLLCMHIAMLLYIQCTYLWAIITYV